MEMLIQMHPGPIDTELLLECVCERMSFAKQMDSNFLLDARK